MSGVLLCKSKCKSYDGCTCVRYDIQDLKCELIYGTNGTCPTVENGSHILQVHHKEGTGCRLGEITVFSRLGSSKCVEDSRGVCGEQRTEPDKRTLPGSVRPTGDECILDRIDDIRMANKKSKAVKLPRKLKPQMALTLCGAADTGASVSVITLSKNPKTTMNFLTWFHIKINWGSRLVDFTGPKGTYEGDFPISDPFNFTFGLEMLTSSTKVYVNKVLVNTICGIPWIEEFTIMRFSQVHFLLIKKTDGGCDSIHGA